MRWESGRNIPTADNRERIASALDDQSLVYEDVDEEEDAQWPLSRQDTALMGELMGLLAASFKEKAAR